MKMKLVYALVSFVLAIQMYRPAKNNAVTTGLNNKNMATVFGVPTNVQTIFTKACYDCHSNNTTYPWYANIQPVYSWINHHVTEGKDEWNADEFANYSLRKQFHKLKEIKTQVAQNKMPMDSYTWMHGDAKLSNDDKEQITNWVTNLQDSLQHVYPIDSLQRKKK